MSDLKFGDCIGCGLCVLGCPAYEETGFDVLTARGRNKALQSGLAAGEMVESIWACTLCGYCDAICPTRVNNVEIVLDLRRQLAKVRLPPSPPPGSADWKRTLPATTSGTIRPASVVSASAGPCPILCARARLHDSRAARIDPVGAEVSAPHRPAVQSGRRLLPGSLEAGRAMPARVRSRSSRTRSASSSSTRVSGRAHDAAPRRLQLTPPFYRAPPDREPRPRPRVSATTRFARRYDAKTMDLNRLARSTSAGSVQGPAATRGHPRRAHAPDPLRADRIITCSPADYLAFTAYSGRETLHHGMPALNEITTDVLIIGASLPPRPSARWTPAFARCGAQDEPRHKICSGILSPRGYAFLRDNFDDRQTARSMRPRSPASTSCSPTACMIPFIPGRRAHLSQARGSPRP